MKFTKYDVVRCVDPIEPYLRKDALYEVEGLRPEEGRIVITDERMVEGWYKESRFELAKAEDYLVRRPSFT